MQPNFFILPECRGIPTRLQELSKSSVKNIQCRSKIHVRVKTVRLALIFPNEKWWFPKDLNNPNDGLLKFKAKWSDTPSLPTVTEQTAGLERTVAAQWENLIDRIDGNPSLQLSIDNVRDRQRMMACNRFYGTDKAIRRQDAI